MILVDSRIGSIELVPHFKQLGIPCESTSLEYGDIAFEGNGPNGTIAIGVERKTLHDMLACIETARFGGHQLPGMKEMYNQCYLVVEGDWAAGQAPNYEGLLLERRAGMSGYMPCRARGGQVMYSKLYRYLLSVGLSGMNVLQSKSIAETARNVAEVYHYFSKEWHNHTSMLTPQKIVIPTLGGKPPLARRWAIELDGIGVKQSLEAAHLFKTGIGVAHATEAQWASIKGIGRPTAEKIVKEIWGERG